MFRTYVIAGPIFAFWEETGLGFTIPSGEKIKLPIDDGTSGMRIGFWKHRGFLAFRDDIRQSIVLVTSVNNLQPDR